MITCYFENKNKDCIKKMPGGVFLRHVVFDAFAVENNKVLLIKRAKYLREGGKYAIPGGFLERGERITEGVLRELKEETGYEGKIITLFRINDDPKRKNEFCQNVSFVFLVKVGKKTGKPDKETEKVCWFDLDNLPGPKNIAFDHYENIMLYKKWKKEKSDFPILQSIKNSPSSL